MNSSPGSYSHGKSEDMPPVAKESPTGLNYELNQCAICLEKIFYDPFETGWFHVFPVTGMNPHVAISL